ncbi:MAG TPA: diguanylate cyclase [Abditibacteriaceae bacterium]|jgi:diguanylate cyclase (GGDEF)-like protein
MAHILVVEDDSEINTLMALTLRVEDYDVSQARDGATALRLVGENPPDLILLDIMMPRMSGYDVARALQDKPSTAHIPIIFVTAKGEMEDRVVGLDMAVDYICKPFATPELLARVRAALRMRKLQDELRVSNEQLSRLATTDPLTSLHNRRRFDEQLEDELRRARRFEHSLAVVLFDLDHFKSINDNWGHAQGDVVLQTFASILRDSSRRVDTIARLGGEEFGAILPATDDEGALNFAEKVRALLEETGISCRTREGEIAPPLHLTTSAGVAIAGRITEEGSIPELASSLVELADRQLYAAKEGGRNRVVAESREHWALS